MRRLLKTRYGKGAYPIITWLRDIRGADRQHDDLVLALAIATWWLARQKRTGSKSVGFLFRCLEPLTAGQLATNTILLKGSNPARLFFPWFRISPGQIHGQSRRFAYSFSTFRRPLDGPSSGWIALWGGRGPKVGGKAIPARPRFLDSRHQ